MLRLTRTPDRADRWRQERPDTAQVSALIDEPLEVVSPAGAPLLAYRPLTCPEVVQEASSAVRLLPFMQARRGGEFGLASRSVTFGARPRLPYRHDYCAPTVLSRERPAAHLLLVRLAAICEEHYADANPAEYQEHRAIVRKGILPDWRLGDTVFTSGIINDTAALAYHRDQNNIPGSWSAMVTLRDDGLDGGYLIIPELDVAVRTAHGSVLLFQGERWWHGVSPIRRTRRGARRYSIVFYALAPLKDCLCADEERERYKRIRQQKEDLQLREGRPLDRLRGSR